MGTAGACVAPEHLIIQNLKVLVTNHRNTSECLLKSGLLDFSSAIFFERVRFFFPLIFQVYMTKYREHYVYFSPKRC